MTGWGDVDIDQAARINASEDGDEPLGEAPELTMPQATRFITQTGNAANSEFIAAAPQLVTDLTAALERVEKLANRLGTKNPRLYALSYGEIEQLIRDALEGK